MCTVSGVNYALVVQAKNTTLGTQSEGKEASRSSLTQTVVYKQGNTVYQDFL